MTNRTQYPDGGPCWVDLATPNGAGARRFYGPLLGWTFDEPDPQLGGYMNARRDGKPVDPVARFHLGNGARVERLNWLADTSPKGFDQSLGIMVNYLYDPERIENNVEAFSSDGEVDAAAAVRRMARQP